MRLALDLLALALLAVIFAALVERPHFISDRRTYDGERALELCVGQKYTMFSFTCVEVPR